MVYRGKYPNRIKSVSCGTSRIVCVQSNDGDSVQVPVAAALAVGLDMPRPGEDFTPWRELAATLAAVTETTRTIKPDNWRTLACFRVMPWAT